MKGLFFYEETASGRESMCVLGCECVCVCGRGEVLVMCAGRDTICSPKGSSAASRWFALKIILGEFRSAN